MKNWKTTSAGIAMLLSVATHVFNDLKSTGTITLEYTEIATLMGGLGLIFARDFNVSSEQSGVKPPTTTTETTTKA